MWYPQAGHLFSSLIWSSKSRRLRIYTTLQPPRLTPRYRGEYSARYSSLAFNPATLLNAAEKHIEARASRHGWSISQELYSRWGPSGTLPKITPVTRSHEPQRATCHIITSARPGLYTVHSPLACYTTAACIPPTEPFNLETPEFVPPPAIAFSTSLLPFLHLPPSCKSTCPF
jgi:hypothetical protein